MIPSTSMILDNKCKMQNNTIKSDLHGKNVDPEKGCLMWRHRTVYMCNARKRIARLSPYLWIVAFIEIFCEWRSGQHDAEEREFWRR